MSSPCSGNLFLFPSSPRTLPLEARAQLSKSIWIFHWGFRKRLVCARQEQGSLHLLLICAQAWPGLAFLYVLLSFHSDLFLFIQSWNTQEAGPHLPYPSGTWHLYCSYTFSLLFSCRFFLYIQMPNPTLMQLPFPSVFQCNSWRSFEKCDALHPFCQPGSPAVVVNESLWPWTRNVGLTFSFSHFFLCWSLEIRILPHLSLSSL